MCSKFRYNIYFCLKISFIWTDKYIFLNKLGRNILMHHDTWILIPTDHSSGPVRAIDLV